MSDECECGHVEDEHERAHGACQAVDDGIPCRCVQFEAQERTI